MSPRLVQLEQLLLLAVLLPLVELQRPIEVEWELAWVAAPF